MPHPLEEWLPNDAPWATLSNAVLKKQCTIRNLPITGLSKDLVQHLSAYSQAKMNTPDTKRLHTWLTWPVNRASYEVAALAAGKARLQVVRVVDKPGPRRDSLRRDFEICDERLWNNHAWEKREPVTVSIDIVLQCDCPKTGLCEHKIFILRFVLNCPEPYLWQRALLPSELQTIYQHSHAIRAFGPNNSEIQTGISMLCFRDYDQSLDKVYHCLQCGRGMHSQCSFNPWRVRKPMREDTCWICYDIEWDIEKFSWSNRVLPAAPSTAPAAPAQNESAVDATRELIQRKEPEDDDSKTLSSSSDEDSEEEQPYTLESLKRRFPFLSFLLSSSSSTLPALESTIDQVVDYPDDHPPMHRKSAIKTVPLTKKGAALSKSIQNNESIPLAGNPALIWQKKQRTREQQQQREKEGHQAALPNLSPAPGHDLSTLNSGGGHIKSSEVVTAPDAARVPARDSDHPRASASAVQALASPTVTTTPQHIQAGTTSLPVHNSSIAGGMSQAPQVSVTTATTAEPAGPTGAQHTTSINADNSTSVAATIPIAHLASAPVPFSSGFHAGVDHTKTTELVRECSRLARRSTQIRKKSERDAKRMEKKHKRELEKITKMKKKHRREKNNIKRKSKREAKRLEKKIKRLEKKVLKALAGPDVVDGAAT